MGSVVLLAAVLVAGAVGFAVPPSAASEGLYPEWAHSHFVWLSSGHNQSDCVQLVQDYLARNISVGGTNIDSRWATGINTFSWDKTRFPDAGGMVRQLHGLGVRVIAWATSVIDTDSPNFAFANASGFLVSKGALIKWWHGHGAFIDLTYEPAVAYWKSLMDQVLVESQLDGFKCDGTDPYIVELERVGGAKGHDGKHIGYRQYADLYYETFLNHSRTRNPFAIVWSRPTDSLGNWIYLNYSPRSVSFSGWVGDQDPTFAGLKVAHNNMLRSAWANYVSFGSDTGGYRCCGSTDKKRGRTREVLLRWAQLNSLMGLFENGGDNEHRPWMFDQPQLTTAIYKTYVDLHMSLSLYLLSSGTEAFYNGTSIVTPVAQKPPLDLDPVDYAYFLGPSLFVTPVLEANVTRQKVHFPRGHDYVDWFDKSTLYRGGTSVDYEVSLDGGRYPVFHVQGNLLPLLPAPASNTILLLPAPDGALMVLLPCPRPGGSHSTVIRRYRQPSQEVSYSYDSGVISVILTAHVRRVHLLLTGLSSPLLSVRSLSGTAYTWRTDQHGALSIDVDCRIGEQLKLRF